MRWFVCYITCVIFSEHLFWLLKMQVYRRELWHNRCDGATSR
jgi:hypothetical protein